MIEDKNEKVQITVVAEDCEIVEGLRVKPGEKIKDAEITVTAKRGKSVVGVRFG